MRAKTKFLNTTLIVTAVVLLLAVVTTVTYAAFTDYKKGASNSITVGQIGDVSTTLTVSGVVYPGATLTNAISLTINNPAGSGNVNVKMSGMTIGAPEARYEWNSNNWTSLNAGIVTLSLHNKVDSAYASGADGWYLIDTNTYAQYISSVATGLECVVDGSTGNISTFAYNGTINAGNNVTLNLGVDIAIRAAPVSGYAGSGSDTVTGTTAAYLLNGCTGLRFAVNMSIDEVQPTT